MPEDERMLHTSAHADDDELDLWAMAQVLWKRRRLIAAVTGVGTIASAIIVFSQPNVYSATATIMPVDSSSDRLSMALSSLGALGGLASQAGMGLKGSVSDKFIALLESRSLAESVITKHDMLPALFPERWDSRTAQWKADPFSLAWITGENRSPVPTLYDAHRRMKELVATKADRKTGLVEISVKLTNPQAAADIANYFVIELNNLLQGNSFTTARKNKQFLEKQHALVAGELSSAENSLKSFQEKHKLVSLDAQTQASVQAYATLKSQLMAKEMEISLQANSASDNDVQLIGLKQEAEQLRENIASLETGTSNGLVSFKDAPKLGLRFAQLTRDLLVRQKVFELITQQYELSKIEEAKEDLTFQVVDRAIPADRKSSPKRLTIIAITSLLSMLFAGAVALGLDKVKAWMNGRMSLGKG